MRLLLLSAFVAALLPTGAQADNITVDCNGGADYTSIKAAILAAGPDDTVVVFPCEYWIGYGWPVTLDCESPSILGVQGAGEVVLLGDGSRSVFHIAEGVTDARVVVSGLTFRSVNKVINKDYDATGHMEFTHNVIEDCGMGLDATGMDESSVIAWNTIRNNSGHGLNIFHCSATIMGNEITENTTGIRGACCERPLIRGNHIHHNVEYGIRTGFYGMITDNTIDYNGGTGIELNSVTSNPVERNVIRFNGTGVQFYMYTSFSFHYNDVYGNGSHNLECMPGAAGSSLDATMNWWGTTDPLEIAAGIWDCNDDPELETSVVFQPCCSDPGCAPTAALPASWGAIKGLYR